MDVSGSGRQAWLGIGIILGMGVCGCVADKAVEGREADLWGQCRIEHYAISDMPRSLSETEKSFVRFCDGELESLVESEEYWIAECETFRREGDPAHEMRVRSYRLNQLAEEAFLHQGNTDCRYVTYWSTPDRKYFALVSGGCLVYVDALYGPFVYEEKWRRVEEVKEE